MMTVEGAAKQDLILEKAIKRFSHFGINKTTLKEVAEDAFMTKQLLLYYFPDKQALVIAVLQKIMGEYVQILEEKIAAAKSTESGILILLETQYSFLEKYYMLVSELIIADSASGKTSLIQVKQELHGDEETILSELLKKGIAKGELKKINTRKAATLIIETLSVFAQSVIDKKGLPAPNDLREGFAIQREVIHLLYHGLRQ